MFAMTGTIDVLKAIAEGSGPSQLGRALGYAGWGEGQLDEEMTRHGWFAAQVRAKQDPVRHADRRALGGLSRRKASTRACWSSETGAA